MSKDTSILSALLIGAVVLFVMNKKGLIGTKNIQTSSNSETKAGAMGKLLCTCVNPITGVSENHGWMSKRACQKTCGVAFISKN